MNWLAVVLKREMASCCFEMVSGYSYSYMLFWRVPKKSWCRWSHLIVLQFVSYRSTALRTSILQYEVEDRKSGECFYSIPTWGALWFWSNKKWTVSYLSYRFTIVTIWHCHWNNKDINVFKELSKWYHRWDRNSNEWIDLISNSLL